MKRHIYLAMTTLVLAQGSANAGGFSPDAGSMLANTQSSLSAHTEKQLEGFPLEYQPKLRWTDDFSVQVDAVVIEGNTLMPVGKLQVAVKGYVGKRLMVNKLSAVSATVTKAYRDAGFRVKAYIPEQTFSHGRLVVQVIEAGSTR